MKEPHPTAEPPRNYIDGFEKAEVELAAAAVKLAAAEAAAKLAEAQAEAARIKANKECVERGFESCAVEQCQKRYLKLKKTL